MGWGLQWYDLADSAENARVVVVPQDGGIASVVVRLERGGEIQGSVRSRTGDSLSPRVVMVTHADAFQAWAIRPQVTPGRFRIRGLPDGDWKVAVSKETMFSEDPAAGAYYHWIWHGGASFDSATVIAIRDHATVDGIEIRSP